MATRFANILVLKPPNIARPAKRILVDLQRRRSNVASWPTSDKKKYDDNGGSTNWNCFKW
jgi:hypothetical protein